MLYVRKGKNGGLKCQTPGCGYFLPDPRKDNGSDPGPADFSDAMPSLDYDGPEAPLPTDDDAPDET